jgi:hypothetical protein
VDIYIIKRWGKREERVVVVVVVSTSFQICVFTWDIKHGARGGGGDQVGWPLWITKSWVISKRWGKGDTILKYIYPLGEKKRGRCHNMDLILCCTCAKTKWATIRNPPIPSSLDHGGVGDGMRGGEGRDPNSYYAHTFKVWRHIGILIHPSRALKWMVAKRPRALLLQANKERAQNHVCV